MSAAEDHSSPQSAIPNELENAGEDVSDDTHIKELADELRETMGDADLSDAHTAVPPDELPESAQPDHPTHIEELPFQEEEDHLREVLAVHDSPENTAVPGEEPGTATGEETLEELQPLVSQALEIALVNVIPDMIHRVESALVPKITQQTESIIAEQLPGIIDRIVSREIEKMK
jgi:hypothetical protein